VNALTQIDVHISTYVYITSYSFYKKILLHIVILRMLVTITVCHRDRNFFWTKVLLYLKDGQGISDTCISSRKNNLIDSESYVTNSMQSYRQLGADCPKIMWKSGNITTLWASAACYKGSLNNNSVALVTSLHCIFWWFLPHFHFASLITFLTRILKLLGLQDRVPQTSVVGWFQSCMVLFTKEYFVISVLCFLFLIFLSWSTLLR
jgi:hypothetical protein